MRKYFGILGLAFLASALSFATGQARIDFINHTSATVRFYVDNDPACSGDIIPNGTCSEYVSAPATHTLSASASGYEPISRTVTVNDGDVKEWTLGDEN